ncbi:MAG: phosphoribosyltransferase [Myxococcales bacterium]
MHPDRKLAGRQLAESLHASQRDDPVVLAIARSGVPVGSAVAQALGLPFEVVVVGKLEMATDAIAPIGALAEDDSLVLNVPDGDRDYIFQLVTATRGKRDALVASLRKGRRLTNVRGRMVLLVDDTISTGATACAAIRLLRRAGAARIVVAVPFALAPAAARVQCEADALVALEVATPLSRIDCQYASFEDLSDERILADLASGPAPEPLSRPDLRDAGAERPPESLGQPSKSSNAPSKHFDASPLAAVRYPNDRASEQLIRARSARRGPERGGNKLQPGTTG